MTVLLFSLWSLVTGPAEALEHLSRADELLLGGDHAAAEQAFAAARAEDPDSLEALWGLGLLAQRRGEHAIAIECFQAILARDANDDDARLALVRSQHSAGHTGDARSTLATLRQRHPEMPGALELATAVDAGPGDKDATPRPFARAGVGAAWDSNLSLGSGATLATEGESAGLALADVVIGVGWRDLPVALTVLGDLSLQTPLSNRTATEAFTPTTVGGALLAHRTFDALTAAVDLRYQELYGDLFATHVQRAFVPSLWLGWRAHPQHRVRLLVAADVRQLDGGDGTPMSPRLTLRDHITVGATKLIAELGARRTMISGAVGPLTNREFNELGVLVFAEHRITAAVDAFGLISAAGRAFAQSEPVSAETQRETEWSGQLGARWHIGDIELHAEYGFARRLARKKRDFARHQLGLGVRYWYF